ncbi:MAG: hypothetical protein RLZZ200_1196 [Pseudomonadota bacterium]
MVRSTVHKGILGWPVAAATLLVACGGGGGSDSGGGSPAPSGPSLTLTLSSASAKVRDAVTLNWTSTASSCTASGDWTGAKSATGSESLSRTTAGTYQFTLNCASAGGQSTSSTATLTVRARVASDYYVYEDAGVSISNSNEDTVRVDHAINYIDLNGDGIQDSLIVGGEFPNSGGTNDGSLPVSWFKTQRVNVILGGTTQSDGASLFPAGRPTYIAASWPVVFDFNDDGKEDIVIPDLGPDTTGNPGAQTTVYLAEGGTWKAATMELKATSLHGGAAGVINGQRVFFSNTLHCECADEVPFLYRFDGAKFVVDRSLLPSFVTDSTTYTPIGGQPREIPVRNWTSVAIHDLDGDGRDDLILGDFAVNFPTDPIPGSRVMFGSASGWATGSSLRLPDPQGAPLSVLTMLSVQVADLDNDDRPDLVVSYTDHYNTHGIQILLNNGNRSFTDASSTALGAMAYLPDIASRTVKVMDLNGDSCVDIVEYDKGGRWLLNDCQGHFVDVSQALASVTNVKGRRNILPFPDSTGRVSFFVPMTTAPATGSTLGGVRYARLRNLENLPTPVNGQFSF